MKLINDIEHYNKIIERAKNNFKFNFSNAMFFKDEIIDLINKKVFYYLEIENGLVFVKKDKNINYLYYYLDSFDEIGNIKSDKKSMIELIDRTNINRNIIQVDSLIKAGYKKYATNMEMEILFDEKKKVFEKTSNFNITYATSEDKKKIIKLWESVLDSITIPLPDDKQIKKYIVEEKIIIVRDSNELVIGAMLCDVINNKALISHVAVEEEQRGKGVGTLMIKHCLNNSNYLKYSLWVNEENKGAIKLYERLGFKPTKKISIQLLKEWKWKKEF